MAPQCSTPSHQLAISGEKSQHLLRRRQHGAGRSSKQSPLNERPLVYPYPNPRNFDHGLSCLFSRKMQSLEWSGLSMVGVDEKALTEASWSPNVPGQKLPRLGCIWTSCLKQRVCVADHHQGTNPSKRFPMRAELLRGYPVGMPPRRRFWATPL